MVLCSLYPSLLREWRNKGNMKNLQFWPETAASDLWYNIDISNVAYWLRSFFIKFSLSAWRPHWVNLHDLKTWISLERKEAILLRNSFVFEVRFCFIFWFFVFSCSSSHVDKELITEAAEALRLNRVWHELLLILLSMSSSFAHDRIVGMEKIPFVVMVALLVLRLSVKVLGNAGKGHLYNSHLTQISLIFHGIPTKRYWQI